MGYLSTTEGSTWSRSFDLFMNCDLLQQVTAEVVVFSQLGEIKEIPPVQIWQGSWTILYRHQSLQFPYHPCMVYSRTFGWFLYDSTCMYIYIYCIVSYMDVGNIFFFWYFVFCIHMDCFFFFFLFFFACHAQEVPSLGKDVLPHTWLLCEGEETFIEYDPQQQLAMSVQLDPWKRIELSFDLAQNQCSVFCCFFWQSSPTMRYPPFPVRYHHHLHISIAYCHESRNSRSHGAMNKYWLFGFHSRLYSTQVCGRYNKPSFSGSLFTSQYELQQVFFSKARWSSSVCDHDLQLVSSGLG